MDYWLLRDRQYLGGDTLESNGYPLGSRKRGHQSSDHCDPNWVASRSAVCCGHMVVQEMSQIHFHLVYIGNDRFQLTITCSDQQSNPIIEIMTFGELQQSIRSMKPGAMAIRFAKTTIDCTNMNLDAAFPFFVSFCYLLGRFIVKIGSAI